MTHNMYIWLYLYKLPLFGGWNMLQKAHPFFYQKIQLGEPTKDGPNDRNSSDGFHLHPRSFTVKAPESHDGWKPFAAFPFGSLLYLFRGDSC